MIRFRFNKGVFRQYLTAFCASLGAICAGSGYMWVTPLLSWFLSPDSEVPMTLTESSWVVNAVEVGDLFTPIPVACIVDLTGRKPLLLASAPIYVASWISVLLTRSVTVLYIVRFVQGLALGIMYTILPMYLGEIAGTQIRGSIGIFVQTMWYGGIVYTYIIGSFLDYWGMAWGSLIVPVVFFGCFIWFPESPYYLVMRGKHEEAKKELRWLRAYETEEELNAELDEIIRSIEEEKASKGTWKDLVCTPEGRKAILLQEVVMVTALLGGLVTMLTYVSLTFAKINSDGSNAELYTIIMGVVLLIMVPFTGPLLDYFGRRPVLLWSCAICTFALIVAAVFSYLHEETDIDVSSYNWIFFVSVIVYILVIACGVEAVFPVLQAELFPSSTRAFASGVAGVSLTIWSLLSLIIYQQITQHLWMFLNFVLFAIFCAFGFISLYLYLPETKGLTFSEIQKILK